MPLCFKWKIKIGVGGWGQMYCLEALALKSLVATLLLYMDIELLVVSVSRVEWAGGKGQYPMDMLKSLRAGEPQALIP